MAAGREGASQRELKGHNRRVNLMSFSWDSKRVARQGNCAWALKIASKVCMLPVFIMRVIIFTFLCLSSPVFVIYSRFAKAHRNELVYDILREIQRTHCASAGFNFMWRPFNFMLRPFSVGMLCQKKTVCSIQWREFPMLSSVLLWFLHSSFDIPQWVWYRAFKFSTRHVSEAYVILRIKNLPMYTWARGVELPLLLNHNRRVLRIKIWNLDTCSVNSPRHISRCSGEFWRSGVEEKWRVKCFRKEDEELLQWLLQDCAGRKTALTLHELPYTQKSYHGRIERGQGVGMCR